jgi:hypothetical protein
MNDYSDLVFLMGAMVLFSVFANNANDTMVRSNTLLVQAEVEYTAIAISQNILDEARSRTFDQVIAAGGGGGAGQQIGNAGLLGNAGIPNGFTAANTLGPDAGEAYPNFNDFDDYHGLNIVRASEYGDFTVRAAVFYVTDAAPAVNANTRTTLKRITVTVTHPELTNPIVASYVKTYY